MSYTLSKNTFPRLKKAAVILIPGITVAAIMVLVYPNQAHFLLLALALILMVIGAKNLSTYLSAKNWVQLEGIILAISEEYIDVLYQYTPIKYYFPKIKYQYEYGGQSYSSDSISFEVENIWIPEVDTWGIETPDNHKFWNEWEIGDKISIFINSKKPSNSVLVRDLNNKRKSHHLAYIVAGIIIGVLWLYLI